MKQPDLTLQSSERSLLTFLCVALVILQIFDLHSSLLAATTGRSESNPLILALIAHIGFVPALVAFKSASIAVIAGYFLVVRRFERTLWPAISLVPVCAAYITVVINNYS